MKRFFGSPWFIWAVVILIMALTGTLNAAALVISGLFALALLGESNSMGEIYNGRNSGRSEELNL